LDELSEFPALIPAPGGAVLAAGDGTCVEVGVEYARARFRSGAVMVAHAAFVAGRLKVVPSKPLFDVLELFAFVRPGVPCVPSPLGMARALGLESPDSLAEQALVLRVITEALLAELAVKGEPEKTRLQPLAQLLLRSGWRWAPAVIANPRKRARRSRAWMCGAICPNGKTKRCPPSLVLCRSPPTRRAAGSRS
jgi:ATP-dependent DNA helicase DinG